jgi:hypothetical protein
MGCHPRVGLLLLLVPVLVTCAARAADPPPRAARSVHLAYSSPAPADAFYNELTVEQSVPGSYFMACGFNHGYFGIQEKSRGEKVVIFSVWDPTKGDDAKAVPADQRVEILHQDKDVEVKRFGGEGTGAQSFFKYDWKVNEPCKFLIRAKVEDQKTAYAAWFYLSESKTWKHLATFRTRTGGERLKGLYSFIEDFRRDTKSATEARRACFANAWILDSAADEWKSLATARFTASGAKWEAKDAIDAGVTEGRFYLQTGGETKTTTSLNSKLTRPANNAQPPDVPKE